MHLRFRRSGIHSAISHTRKSLSDNGGGAPDHVCARFAVTKLARVQARICVLVLAASHTCIARVCVQCGAVGAEERVAAVAVGLVSVIIASRPSCDGLMSLTIGKRIIILFPHTSMCALFSVQGYDAKIERLVTQATGGTITQFVCSLANMHARL